MGSNRAEFSYKERVLVIGARVQKDRWREILSNLVDQTKSIINQQQPFFLDWVFFSMLPNLMSFFGYYDVFFLKLLFLTGECF